ncbi:MAG: hypothetical protein AUG80_19675 [Candidatus Rokubacteria bacterium 13_1_20CM_4_68_9]|nr:MAG: hypothetical protein AUG80_19675 [Candidatus Rokubacteria bacterium 13_1_20CM_4_68_9]
MMLLWVAVFCLAVTMFFSAAEMSFIAANRLRIRHLAEEGNTTAAAYLDAFRRPERTLSTAMMGVTISHIVASSAATFALLPTLGGMAPLVVTAILTPIMLVFGEIIPKAVAREWATALIVRVYREPGEADVTSQEAEMIDKIFDLGDTTVREIMVPLVDVTMLPATASVRDAVDLIRDRGFSRIPIYRERETNLVGVVAAMDILRRGAEARRLDDLMRPPYYVPETKRIDDLLREMQRGRMHLAIVVDEYGGSTGIVTLEDIVEEIVGEIQDEHDRSPAPVDRLPDGTYWVAGRANIDELNEAMGWTLPKQDYETVAGLVLATLGRIPRTGEELQVPGYTITVLEAGPRHVAAVKIALAPPRQA